MKKKLELTKAILEAAQLEFWKSIAAAYPECKTGDVSPEEAIYFDVECRKVVERWLKNNSPAPKPFDNYCMITSVEKLPSEVRELWEDMVSFADVEVIAVCETTSLSVIKMYNGPWHTIYNEVEKEGNLHECVDFLKQQYLLNE